MEQTLAGLGNRIFLMNNVHEDEPVVFETRWCLSYLRGPLTRSQIKLLMDARRDGGCEDRAVSGLRLLPALNRQARRRVRFCLRTFRSTSCPFAGLNRKAVN